MTQAPTKDHELSMQRNAEKLSDEELEWELYAANPPGNDVYAVLWLEVLQAEKDSRTD